MLPSYVSQLGYFFDTGSWIFSIHGESQNCILRGRQESGEDRPTLLPITLDLKSSPVIWSAPLLLFPHLDLGSSQCGSRPRAITFHGFIEVSH
jgi:hypothetical protein